MKSIYRYLNFTLLKVTINCRKLNIGLNINQ
jgi:hypothetical protein